MSVKFQLSINDCLIFYKRGLKKKNLLFQNYIYLIAACCAFYLGINDLVFNFIIVNGYKVPESLIGNIVWLNIIYEFILLSGVIFLMRYLFIKKISNQIKNTPQLSGERELILDDDVLIVLTPFSKSEFKYSSICNFELIQDYCFIYLNERDVIIIPLGTLELENFIKELKEKLKI